MKTNILFVLATILLAPTTGAQPSQPGPLRVTLVAGPSPSKGGRVEVVRRAQRMPANLVIVDRNATAEDLAAGLAMMNSLRQQYGDSLTADFRARPDVIRPGRTWEKGAYRTWLIEQLVRLRTAKPAEVADLGVVRAVHIFLPAQNGSTTGDRGKK